MRVLVAEDHPALARSVANGLREEGYAVDLTFRGDEALQLILANPYDCVVLDVMLPEKDGWAILQSMRRRGLDTPVLMLTSRDGTDDRVKGLNLGADDYLVKPFEWEELLARLRAVIRRGHGRGSAVVTVADLEIDTTAKSVRRGGQPILLTAKEYALLEYLAHRAGQVVTRQDIWAHVYDQYDEAASNVIDVYIGYLRAKVDKGHGIKLIHTRRGLGFVLTAEP
jgi:two-component system copper resistance phosphate regulon response regulator CusR